MIRELLPMLAVGALPFATAGVMIGAAYLSAGKREDADPLAAIDHELDAMVAVCPDCEGMGEFCPRCKGCGEVIR